MNYMAYIKYENYLDAAIALVVKLNLLRPCKTTLTGAIDILAGMELPNTANIFWEAIHVKIKFAIFFIKTFKMLFQSKEAAWQPILAFCKLRRK